MRAYRVFRPSYSPRATAQLMYANIFDHERARVVTVRSKAALKQLLKMDAVLGGSAEVSFLLKNDTEFLLEFVFRDHVLSLIHI